MPSSAIATYFAIHQGNTFRYVFLLRNTSMGTFDIYSLLINAQYEVPLVPGGLQDIAPLSAPQGWQLLPSSPEYGFLFGQTNFAGTPAQSGYILPGVVGTFSFDSSSAPPETLPFGCCFYNENDEWGFAFNGSANRVPCIPPSEFPRPWPHPILEEKPIVLARDVPMKGTHSRTIGGEDGSPSVNITYDRLGNIIRMTPNALKLAIQSAKKS